jgi:methionyl aminopeptidase
MSIESQQDLVGLLKIGRLIGETLQRMKSETRAGMTTRQLDQIGADYLTKHGARSAPQLTYNYPGFNCISINDEAAHGIPGDRVIQEGDVVSLDVSAELGGYFADAALTVCVPPVTALKGRLIACAEAAFWKGIAAARAGTPLNEIGRAVDNEVRRQNFSIIQELPGHGVGRSLHEDPTVPNFYVKRFKQPLTKGLVITIEPYVAARRTHIYEEKDGWTLKTMNGSLSASYEHTIMITEGEPILVTAV